MIFVAADAKSQDVKKWIEEYLSRNQHQYSDVGPKSDNDKQDITDFTPELARNIKNTESTGIAICGNGIGMSICLNRYKGIRAGLAVNPEMAASAKLYDNCNILCLASWNISDESKLQCILDSWFLTKFEQLPRRIARTSAMDSLG